MLGIAQAFAQDATTTAADAGAAGGLSSFGSLMPLILIFAVFYFLIIRPQQKRMKEHSKMVNALRRGDKVVTSGGIYATITKVEEDAGILHLEVSPNVVIRVKRDTVTERIAAPGEIAKEPAGNTVPFKKKKKDKAETPEETKPEDTNEANHA